MPSRKLNFDEFVHVITQRRGHLSESEMERVKRAYNWSAAQSNAVICAACIKVDRDVAEQDAMIARMSMEYVRSCMVTDNYGMRIDSNRRQPETVRYFLRQDH